MQSFVLQPTQENILETWENDVLGRRQDIAYFVSLLNSLERGTSIALDARWGAGKTFFIKQAKLVLDAFNEHTSIYSKETGQRVKSAWDKIKNCPKLEFQPQVTVYYDAWANDNDEDPIISLIYTILQNVSSDYSFKATPSFFAMAAGVAEIISGKAFSSILQTLKQNDPLATLRSAKDLHAEIEEFLSSLLVERGNRLIIFVDELDRCKPSFAIQLLERIKHYFSNDQVTFVFSVNLTELQHAVKQIYGADFNSSRYLDRFFDYRIDLPPADISKFCQMIQLKDYSYTYDNVCRAVIRANNLSLREISKFWAHAKTAAYMPTHSDSNLFSFSDGRAIKLCLLCVLPVIIGLKICNQSQYNQFIEGKNSSPLQDVMRVYNHAPFLLEPLLSNDETFSPSRTNNQSKTVTIQEKVDQLYDALFIQEYSSAPYEITIGKCSFSADVKDFLLRVASTLSNFADYS